MTDNTVLVAALTFFVSPIVLCLAILHNYNYLSTQLFVGLVALIVLTVCGASVAYASTYTYSSGLTLTATNFKDAAKRCYEISTGNKYVSEEFNLTQIDICVNPKGVK